MKVEGDYVILEGDSGTATINGMAWSGQTQIAAQSDVTAKIELAGQVKVTAN